MTRNDEIVAAARGCIGARFRPQGRDVRFGFDCVGVAGIAYGCAVPEGYALRGGTAEDIGATIAACGLRPVDRGVGGDLALIAAGGGQYHLAVLTDTGFVHADAGLRRVVETPGRPMDAIGYWREIR